MRMIGVVLWSDPLAGKAVFWCEDQGDLAYFDGLNEDTDIKKAFAAGDMVAFDVRRDRNYRLAWNAELVEQRACVDLQDRLRRTARESRAGTDCKIVPFRHPAAKPAPMLAKRKA